MENEWRTIQIFLNKNLNKQGAAEVYEVSMHTDGASNIRCSCKTFAEIGYCSHSMKVTKRIEKNDGNFGLVIPETVSDDVAFEAFSKAETSREFLIKYGKIELC